MATKQITSKTAKRLEKHIEKIQYALTEEVKICANIDCPREYEEIYGSSETRTIDYDSEEEWVPKCFHDRPKKLVKNVESELKVKKAHNEIRTAVTEAKNVRGFHTFRSSEALSDGLCILRNAGGGKYEIVNLHNISLETLWSDGAGLGLANNLQLANSFLVRGHQWVDALEKCAVASRYADKHFTFTKLPAELRVRIYELVLISPRAICRKSSYSTLLTARINVMLVSKQWYQECRPIFWRNNFNIQEWRGHFLVPNENFAANVQELTYEWRGMIKQASDLRKIAAFPKLKYLNLVLGHHLTSELHRSSKGNKLYQEEQSIKILSQQNSFDALFKIRGLKAVRVSHNWADGEDRFVERNKAANDLGTLLNKTLTLPKPQKKTTKRVRKAKRKAPMDLQPDA